MSAFIVERLPILKVPGFDCRRDNANCPGCKKQGPNDHGVYGGGYWFGVVSGEPGHRVALTLEVLAIHYPATVPRPMPEIVSTPRGAVLVVHRERATGEACDWIGAPCEYEVAGYIRAGELYERHGIITRDAERDISDQPDALWNALADQLRAWSDGRRAD